MKMETEMFRNSLLAASIIALAAMATSAGATISKPPHDSCQKWEKREVVKNYWLKRQKTEAWYCVAGESKDHVTASTLSGPSVASKTPDRPDSGGTPDETSTPDDGSTSDTPPSDDTPGKGNNGKGTPNGGPTDGGDPPGGGNTGNDGEG
jgi:hypothetical protein